MKSSVTCDRATSVMSSWRRPISCSSRSKGPSKFVRWTSKDPRSGGARRPVRRHRHRSSTSRASIRYDGRARRGAGVAGDRLPRDGRLGELDRPPDDGVEDLVAEGLDDPVEDLAAVQRARVVHRAEDAEHLEVGVEPVLHLADGVGEQRDPPQREELALQRHQHPVGRGQRVDGEQAQRGRAVDEDHVVVALDLPEHPRQRLLARDLADQLQLGRREVDVAGQQVDALGAGPVDDVADRRRRFVSSRL